MRTSKEWEQPYPNPRCSHYTLRHRDTLRHRGNISSIATYMTQSGKRRIFGCRLCQSTFSQTRDTVFFDLRTCEEKVIMALKILLVRVELSGICFVLSVTEETVLEWLRRAAKQAQQINAHLLRELPVTQVQLDEMWNFIEPKQSAQTGVGKESSQESTDGRQWVFLSFAPEFRLMLATFVGPRTFENALTLILRTAALVLGVPCFFSDGFSSYLPALVAVYHQVKEFPRTGRPGRPKNPIKEPHPDLVYAQVVKRKEKGRLVALSERVLCGAQRLKVLALSVSTSLIERLNLTLRQALAPLVRKGWGFCKEREQMRRRVVFFQAFYNFARPHQSLRVPLPETQRRPLPETQRRPWGLIQPKWMQRTPGMAAGLTDHVWSFRELLTVKFEVIHSQSTSP